MLRAAEDRSRLQSCTGASCKSSPESIAPEALQALGYGANEKPENHGILSTMAQLASRVVHFP
jgi:hypothetical protein